MKRVQSPSADSVGLIERALATHGAAGLWAWRGR